MILLGRKEVGREGAERHAHREREEEKELLLIIFFFSGKISVQNPKIRATIRR